MKLTDYQDAAIDTAVYPSNQGLAYTIIGLNEEAGEVAGQLKRIIRDDDGELTESRREKLVAELGDVLWYVAMCAHELDIDLDEVASLNLKKLKDRKERNTLHGKGDNR